MSTHTLNCSVGLRRHKMTQRKEYKPLEDGDSEYDVLYILVVPKRP